MMILQGHFHRTFDCRGPIVAEKNAGQGPFRLEIDQGFCQASGRFIAKTERGNVGDFFQLPAQRGVQVRMTMPVQICPDSGISIQIAFSVGIIKPHTFSPGDEKRSMPGSAPIPHLRKGMPRMGSVPCGQLVKIGWRHMNAGFTPLSVLSTRRLQPTLGWPGKKGHWPTEFRLL